MKGTVRPGRWGLWLRTIRVRVLAIVLIPCLALLAIGISVAGYLVQKGANAEDWSGKVSTAIGQGTQFTAQLAEERRLTMLRLAGDVADSAALDTQRRLVDAAAGQVGSVVDTLAAAEPAGMGQMNDRQLDTLLAQLPRTRQAVDSGQATETQVYDFYNNLVDTISAGLQGLASSAPDANTAAHESMAAQLFATVEAMSRSNALAAGAVAGAGVTPDVLRQFAYQVGAYHVQAQALLPQLPPDEQANFTKLTNSSAWQDLTAQENALIQRGPAAGGTAGLPLDLAGWQAAASQVTAGLLAVWSAHHQYADSFAVSSGRDTYWDSLAAGVGVLLVTVLALVFATMLANRLIRRLRRLRRETLGLAEERLPTIVARLREGEQVDLDAELPTLDHGLDEIGRVAKAFNTAQHIAVGAAAREAKTREGFNAVFLNIAHRSQVVVHRQLAVLDKAERNQEDPDALATLFQLDNLATRARRNAENLIILGGEQPGRQWSKPVPLVEIVRSAVAETEHYVRVHTTRLPEVSMVGKVVADLIHLLAELVDNATSFSPPGSRVEVHGNVVGKGIVVEIEDQGLGIADEDRERFNADLQDPPDFDVMALSGDSRLGLFVVSRLAARHGISVTLAESAYGGVRAIVLVRAAQIAPPETQQNLEPVATPDSAAPDNAAAAVPTSAEQTVEQTVVNGQRPLPRQRSLRQPSISDPAPTSTAWPVQAPPVQAPPVQAPPVQVPPVRSLPSAAPQPTPEPLSTPAEAVRWPAEEPAPLPQIPTQAIRPVVPPVARPVVPRPNHPEVVLSTPAPGDDRPPLPRRRRQANLSPRLTHEVEDLPATPAMSAGPAPSDTAPSNGNGASAGVLPGDQDTARVAEAARSTMAAFQRGSRQGREAQQ